MNVSAIFVASVKICYNSFMQTEITITVQAADEHNIAVLQKKAAREIFRTQGKVEPEKISLTVIKKSIDARRKPVKVVLRCRVSVGEKSSAKLSYSTNGGASSAQEFLPSWKHTDSAKKVVILGAGPAGLFAALRLLEDGIKPIIIERGSSTAERRRDIAAISTKGIVDRDSNYCFGEGGAGMFSDGKLYTRSNKRGNVSRVLQTLVHFGADEKILTDAHPHVGTDKLPQVVDEFCRKIMECDGEIFYNTRCTGFLIDGFDCSASAKSAPATDVESSGSTDSKRVIGVVTENTSTGAQQEFFVDAVILATGHSACDIYKLVAEAAPAALEAKTFAAGVRIEHPRELIDTIQFHGENSRGVLPSAEYRLTTQVDRRGVYSFCMCPGGFVVPSATAPEQIVINGMSTAKRNSRWSNAAIVTEIFPEDIPKQFVERAEQENCAALAGLFFREWLEHETFLQAQKCGAKKCSQAAPAQRLTDFLCNRKSASLPETSYTPGVVSSRIDEWLFPHIAVRLEKAFRDFDKKMHGFISDDALIIASETRTSTPVRIVRDKKTLECVALRGLYPCGEGSGYAGGITSSAMDGINVAEQIAQILK